MEVEPGTPGNAQVNEPEPAKENNDQIAQHIDEDSNEFEDSNEEDDSEPTTKTQVEPEITEPPEPILLEIIEKEIDG